MGVGKRIREARENLALTRCQLAEAVGVSPSAISNYENEMSHPKECVLYRLFDALRVDANFLFQDEIPQQFVESPSPAEREKAAEILLHSSLGRPPTMDELRLFESILPIICEGIRATGSRSALFEI